MEYLMHTQFNLMQCYLHLLNRCSLSYLFIKKFLLNLKLIVFIIFLKLSNYIVYLILSVFINI